EPGMWAVVLGVPNIRTNVQSTYRVTVHLSTADGGPRPLVRAAAGWYAGDLHMHSGHSDGYWTDGSRRLPVTVADIVARLHAARRDYAAVTDHNTTSHWVDIDRAQGANPDMLLLHAREITTYRGHFNAIGERRFTDFRVTSQKPMRQLLPLVAADGAF